MITAEQFDPEKPYPKKAWAQGPNTFFAATPRGHTRISRTDWIVELTDAKGNETLVVNNAVYQWFFKPLVDEQDAKAKADAEKAAKKANGKEAKAVA